MNFAVLSLFYKNYNYGGVLQAYALNKAIQKRITKNDIVKQICFDFDQLPPSKKLVRFINAPLNTKVECICEKVDGCLDKIGLKKKSCEVFSKETSEKITAFNTFNEMFVLSTDKVYGVSNVHETLDEFDCFIVGSDQVWNPDNIHYNLYFLDFVNKNKYKASYAASISKTALTQKQQKPFKKNLDSFNKISVRENNTEIISSLTKNKVEWVLDPTLLLSLEEWNEVCSKRFDNEEPYLFCYFLNFDKKQQELAISYAKRKALKMIFTTDLRGIYQGNNNFGAENIYDASPSDFLSLIKNAAFVMTDSFHATVFSLIFKKQFVAFERIDFAGMKTRMETLLQLFEAQSRLVDWDKNDFCNIEILEEFDYSQTFKKFSEMKRFSEKYLDDLIKEAKELSNEK